MSILIYIYIWVMCKPLVYLFEFKLVKVVFFLLDWIEYINLQCKKVSTQET